MSTALEALAAMLRNVNLQRVLTVLLGVVPTLLLSPFVALVGLKAASDTIASVLEPDIIGAGGHAIYFVWALMGFWGVFALLVAAFGPIPVRRATAIGLVVGIVAMLVLLLTAGSSPIPNLTALWLLIGPIVVACWQLGSYWTQRRTVIGHLRQRGDL